MWIDETADGCIYDTVDCNHSCRCKYGWHNCEKCGSPIQYPEQCGCEFSEDNVTNQ